MLIESEKRYLCTIVAITDHVSKYDVVMGTLSDDVAPFFPAPAAAELNETDANFLTTLHVAI